MERIEKLREAALSHTHANDEFYYLFHKKYQELNENSRYLRYSLAFDFAFSNLTPNISEGELIVGEIKNNLTPAEQEEWNNIYFPIADKMETAAGGWQHSHMAIDYDLLLSLGLCGIIKKIDGYLAGCAPDKKEFYLCAKSALLAIVKHSENYAREAERLAQNEESPCRREELLEIARICRSVPQNPASSFFEAVQSVHFITYAISLNPLIIGPLQFQLGRPDRYLYPYYKHDIENGIITKERAMLLLDCLGIQINMRVPRGLSSGYMVGGRDKDGNTVENELTEMLMQVIDDIRLVYPAVGFCYTPKADEKYLATACRIISHGRSHPAIFNDEIISEGLRRWGVPEEQSHSYIHSTCVEITPEASSNVWVASPYLNMAGLLLETLSSEYASFEEHLSALFKLLDEKIEKNLARQNEYRLMRATHAFNPLLSCFVNDCLERGLDIENGGARYNWIMPSFVGVPNLVDSLYALKKVVYEDKKITAAGLKSALDNNFKDDEPLRRALSRLPKYGNDLDEVDGLFEVITSHIIEKCKKHKAMHTEGKLIPSMFCYTKHEKFGRETGATPDGRLASLPLGDGAGPCQGRELEGPTASILSSTKWNHRDFIGGIAVNMKFSKSTLGADSLKIMEALVKAYMERGGFEMQINVIDRETLEKAKLDPEKYRDIVVRIGGYSDYFTKLSREMQNEVIMRTEHSI